VLAVPVSVAFAPVRQDRNFLRSRAARSGGQFSRSISNSGIDHEGRHRDRFANNTPTVTITKAEYVVKKGLLTIEATQQRPGSQPANIQPKYWQRWSALFH